MTIEPSGIEIEVPEGETLMQVARDLGYYWPTACQMEGRCATCFILVQDGAAHLSPMGRSEKEALLNQRGRTALDQPVRLACQTQVYGDVRCRKTGVRAD
ncbi:MAG TPA: 2Fe-2S iron-sulfur cluster binding domain-containing protein [Dehalococcoidia bacterium]|nr:2Fe-2S iron-sulfur cluster binding domain-containing protein [Dehalococcoidia bacterium]